MWSLSFERDHKQPPFKRGHHRIPRMRMAFRRSSLLSCVVLGLEAQDAAEANAWESRDETAGEGTRFITTE